MTTDVTAAIVRDEHGRYLITERRHGTHLAGLWEFPGGKRHADESLETCLRRELAEELGADFAVGEKIETIRWRYDDRVIVLHFYRCRLVSGAIEPREGQAMTWVEPERLRDYRFPPADRAIVERLASPETLG